MYLSEIKNFPQCLDMLFSHFELHGIGSSLWPADDLPELYEYLVDCRLVNSSICFEEGHYSLDFETPDRDFANRVYYMIFGPAAGGGDHSLLIDFSPVKPEGFICFEFDTEKLLPFVPGLHLGEASSSIDGGSSGQGRGDIMSIEEFSSFIDNNPRGSEPVIVAVD